MENVFSKVLDTQKRTKTKKEKKRSKKINREPTDVIDPENDELESTLVKMCNLLEYLRVEIKDIRESIESKVELSAMNSLSLKVDNLDGVVNNLSNDLEDLK